MNQEIKRVTSVVQMVHVVFEAYKDYLHTIQKIPKKFHIRKKLPKKSHRRKIRKKKWLKKRNSAAIKGEADELDEQLQNCLRHANNLDEASFVSATNMSASTFKLLLNLLSDELERYSNRTAIAPELRLSVTLLYLSQGCSPQYLAVLYKLGLSTVRKIIFETCTSIWEVLHATYIATPQTTDWEQMADEFYSKTGMPHCLGAIDCKLIHSVRPKQTASADGSKKLRISTSLILRACCDSNYIFTLVGLENFTKESGTVVFADSDIGKKIIANTINVPGDKLLPNIEQKCPYYFVAGVGIPLKTNIMRPYAGSLLTEQKYKFNQKISTACAYVENAFGILATRWKILDNNINVSNENVDRIILASVVLHNFLLLAKDENYFTRDLVDNEADGVVVPGMWREAKISLDTYKGSHPNHASSAAFGIRDILKDYLYEYGTNRNSL